MRRSQPDSGTHRGGRGPQAGFTMLEVFISVVILTLLVGVVLAISTETARFTAYADEDYSAQSEAQRALTRITEILHKTGRATIDETDYPLVWNGGDHLDFLVPRDLDGDGYAFSPVTGDIEWDPVVYTMRILPETATLAVFAGPSLVWTLGSGITEIGFETYIEDNTVMFKEIRISIRADRVTPDGVPVSYAATQSVHMRN